MIDIKQNLLQIRNEIAEICKNSGRSADEVKLVAVSKTKPLEQILQAYQYGQRHFAENYVQEGVEKIHNSNDLAHNPDDQIIWHFIGHIQSNKCKAIAQNFDWVHSLASIKHANQLNAARKNKQSPLNVCVQVQLEKKNQRNGLLLNEVNDFLEASKDFRQLKFRGLMCVLPVGWHDKQADKGFNLVRDTYTKLALQHDNFDTLSLGMSGDYKNALKSGSTMLRLGTAIFGQR